LGFFDLEADALDRGEFFVGEVDDEADAEVVEPCAYTCEVSSSCHGDFDDDGGGGGCEDGVKVAWDV
jgi:hypothetical protein